MVTEPTRPAATTGTPRRPCAIAHWPEAFLNDAGQWRTRCMHCKYEIVVPVTTAGPTVTYRWAWWCRKCEAEVPTTGVDTSRSPGPGHAHGSFEIVGLVKVLVETTVSEDGTTWTCVMQGPSPQLLAKLGLDPAGTPAP